MPSSIVTALGPAAAALYRWRSEAGERIATATLVVSADSWRRLEIIGRVREEVMPPEDALGWALDLAGWAVVRLKDPDAVPERAVRRILREYKVRVPDEAVELPAGTPARLGHVACPVPVAYLRAVEWLQGRLMCDAHRAVDWSVRLADPVLAHPATFRARNARDALAALVMHEYVRRRDSGADEN